MGLTFTTDIERLVQIQLEPLNCFNEGIPLPGKRSADDHGVALSYRGGKTVYHPVTLGKQGLNFVHHYLLTKDDSLLNLANAIALKLSHIALEKDSMLIIPYSFRFPLHGYVNEMMEAPWYSSMAQGIALSLFVRLYKISGEAKHLGNARKLFNSFKPLKGEGTDTWLSCVDANNHLWIEEYPMPVPCLTLNGMVFSLFGIYDYWTLTQDPSAEKILLGGLTTIRHNLPSFRVEGEASYYCLKHKIQSTDYHFVHMDQLKVLYLLTDDIVFKQVGDQFYEDLHKI
ncbi:MAG: hypothetical protein JKY52_13545 [Flavobacteriales bacterium]|nr:hypothetical protein [Flavobacteriales bacterium]